MTSEKNNFLEHYHLQRLLVWQSLFSLALLGGRFIFTPNSTYLFFIWNLVLAWVPVLLAWVAYTKFHSGSSVYGAAALFLAWLFFLPNAPYMITDFLHITAWDGVPLWYDVMLTMSFVWVGLWLFFYSLRLIILFWRKCMHGTGSFQFQAIVIVLASVGVYLGRYLRFNSWDIVWQPVMLAGSLANAFLDATTITSLASFTFIFSVFLYVSFRQADRALPQS